MNTNRAVLSAKTAVRYLTTAVGAVITILDVAGSIFGIPPVASWVAKGVVALTAAAWGAFSAWKEDKENERKALAIELENQKVEADRHKAEAEQHLLLELAQEMRKDLGNIKGYVQGTEQRRIQQVCSRFDAVLHRSQTTACLYRKLEIDPATIARSHASNDPEMVILIDAERSRLPESKKVSANSSAFFDAKVVASPEVEEGENQKSAVRLNGTLG